MDKTFSATWKSSVQPRKQRKYIANAPLHLKGKLLGAHLSPELRKKYGTRNVRVRKGDKVKIVVGQFKGKIGKVLSVETKNTKIIVENIEIIKKDGSKAIFKIHPSNVVIVELDTSDKKRMKSAEAKK